MPLSVDGAKRITFSDGQGFLCLGNQCQVGDQDLLRIQCKTPRGFEVAGTLLSGHVSDKRLHALLRRQGFAMTKTQRRRIRHALGDC